MAESAGLPKAASGCPRGLGDFPDSGFSPSASSGRPRGWHFCGFRSSAKAASGAGVLAGLGAVFSGCHRDGGSGDLGGVPFCGFRILEQCLNHTTYCVVRHVKQGSDRTGTHAFLVLLQNRSVAFLLQLHREGWGRSRGWDFCGFRIFPKVASGCPRGWLIFLIQGFAPRRLQVILGTSSGFP